MRILFLSFYYHPDLCAGSFRNTALISALKKQLPSGSQVDVVTTLPSRYASFSVDAPSYEEMDGVTIHRIALPTHKGGMLDQSLAFLTYAHKVLNIKKNQKYDLVYASSSRLMTAALGALISRQKNIPLYLDIRDIFVDTIKDVLSPKLVWLLKPVFSNLERWTIKRAQKVNLVSGGFREYFESDYSEQSFSYFTNGIDKEFISAQPNSDYKSDSNIISVVYAGNMGEGQGLHLIIPDLAKHYDGRLEFKLLGDGGRRNELEKSLRNSDIVNVELLNPVKRTELIDIYQKADVLFLHLNDYDAFLKVLPSKVFEYAAIGKPIWAGASGFAADFLKQNVTNSAVFKPCDLTEAIECFDKLRLETQKRTGFVEKFSREIIMKKMAKDILCILEPTEL